ncbi:DNA polymerase III subunit delta' [Philodulcilactobacillus myokoensis]|uniref:DNA polymerase III subunit delta n=1 Tax=Philodulcilactobacillus myokoensis TaxID=2929573 RepID=A0A9W6B2E0_9LACO|nr:DNA polymerase III subunit delta' [Philodulcilactobacillus myokoensis]GLB47158.1 DNA polymerase III subunit delta' [Philodulcilactobacillus myokoensis]
MQNTNPIKEAEFKQPNILKHFMNVIKRNDLTHSYIFNGESGSGKLSVALSITMRLFCTNVQNNFPCGKCNECIRISRLEHPDIVFIKPDGRSIKVDQVRFLKSEFSKSAVEGNQKIFIIDQAEKMSTNAANSLLKFIEEPTGNIISFLLTSHKNRILPTIISRTQVVNFKSLPQHVFNQELKSSGVSSTDFNLIGTMTNSAKVAKQWFQDDWFNQLKKSIIRWFQLIARKNSESFIAVSSDILPLVKTPSQKRMAVNMMIQIWRDVLQTKYVPSGSENLKFPQMSGILEKVANHISEQQLIKIIEIILESNRLLSINVQFENILESITLQIMDKLNY